MSVEGFIPLSKTIDWPSDVFAQPALLSQIGVRDYQVIADEAANYFGMRGSLLWYKEIACDLPLVRGCSFALLNEATYTVAPFELDMIPGVALRLPNISCVFRWSSDVLRPVKQVNGAWVPNTDAQGNLPPVELRMNGVGLQADLDGDIQVLLPQGAPALSMSAVELGRTGFVLQLNAVLPFFSAKQTLPPGAPAGFRGVQVQSAALSLPKEFQLGTTPSSFVLEKMFIGSGGLSGTIKGQWTPTYNSSSRTYSGNGGGTLFGLPFGMRSLGITFEQNVPVASAISGEMLLPFFDQPVGVEIALGLDGSLLVRLSATQPAGVQRTTDGLISFTKPDVLKATLSGITFEYQSGLLTTYITGDITPLQGAPALEWPTFHVERLGIDSKGNVLLEGGWLNLPTQYTLDFYGFHMEITKLGFGLTKDGGKWLGFSGGIKFVDGFTAGASVEGMRIIWRDGGAVSFSFEGIGVEFRIPGTLSFKGFVSYRGLDGAVGHRFDGAVRLVLESLDLELDAQLVIGDQAGDKFYGIFVRTQLPAGIPLGATGLALYGVSGLYGHDLVPARLPEEEWFAGWYKRPNIGVTDLRKWGPQSGGMAFGAGVILGTAADNGYLFNGEVILVISLPGPVIMLEGKANLLKKRTSLGDDPMFRAFGVLDFDNKTLLFGLDAQYKYDGDGELIDLKGSAEAYFNWGSASDWHLYLGKDQPRDARIRADVFGRLLTAESYFMLDPRHLALGARAGWDRTWKFGPLRVTLEAWMEGGADLSWSPAQFNGRLWLHGKAALKAYGIGVSLGVDAKLDATVFEPYHIKGEFSVEIGLPWPIDDIGVDIELEWGPEKTPPRLPLPLKEIAVEHLLVTTKWPLPRGDLLLPNYDNGAGFRTNPGTSGPPADPDWAQVPIVPLDARPHLTFSRPVWDTARVGVNGLPPNPERERAGDPTKNEGPATIKYELEKVALERQTASGWQLVSEATASNAGADNRLYGSWAPMPNTPDDGVSTAQVKLWLWSKTPFSYTSHTGGHWGDWFADHFGTAPCLPPPPDATVCCNLAEIAGAYEGYPELISPWTCPETGITLHWERPDPVLEQHFGDPDQTNDDPVCLVFSGGYPYPTREVLLTLAQPAKRVQIFLCPGSQTPGVTWYDSAGVAHPTTQGTGAVDVGGWDIVSLKLTYTTELWIEEICVTTGPNPAAQTAREAAEQRIRDELRRWSHTGAVLAPHTRYRMQVVTKADVKGEGSLKDYSQTHAQTEYAYFQTAGPPALAQLSAPRGHGGEFVSGLDDLRPYVEQTIPRSVAPEGKPPLTRPVYRAYDVGVIFNQDYVDQLYRQDRRDLALYLYDNNNRPARDLQGRVLTMDSGWERADEVTLSDETDRWFQLLTAEGCLIDQPPTVTPNAALYTRAPHRLEPDAFYEARLVPLLLHEDFSYGANFNFGTTSTTRWSVVNQTGATGGPGVWQVAVAGTPPSSAVVQSASVGGGDTGDGANKPGTLLLFGPDGRATFPAADQPAQWGNYRASAYARFMTLSTGVGNGAIGLVFRYRDANNYYRYAIDRGGKRRRLVRVANGSATIIGTETASFTAQPDVDYLISVELLGDRIQVFQDGALVFDVRDGSVATGGIGLYAWNNPGARFADVRVDDLRPNAPVAYRFNFTTSRYADFFHHLHSFLDESWYGAFALQPSSNPDAISSTDLTTILGRAVAPSAAPTTQEQQDYERLARAALGQQAWQDPEQVQLLRVRTGTTNRAFLLTSPEPIDWSRLDLTMQYSTGALTTAVPPGAAKLTGVTFGTTPAQEVVALLLQQGSQLTGWRIDYRALGSSTATWNTYYTFGTEQELSSGVQLRVYSGNRSAAPAVAAGVLQRFVASGTSAGTVVLPAAGVELRIVDATGKVVHQRTFLPPTRFTTTTPRVLRKADGTGCFIIPATLTQESYRLRLTYRRNNRTVDPTSLILSAAGDETAEDVTLDIPRPRS